MQHWFQGIRILNYKDDWLILAQSQELALRHRDVVLAHLESRGWDSTPRKAFSLLLRGQRIWGVVWDSITMQAQLSPARVESILNALKNIKLGQRITVHYLQRVLGLMAAASTVIPLGLLHMRSFQLWLRARGFHPRANPQRQIRVTRQGFVPFLCGSDPVSDFGSHSRSVLSSQDANDRRFPHGLGCGLGWPSSPGIWRGHLLEWHINCLEMMALFRALKYFLQQLRGYHVLVRVDNTAVSLLHKSPGRTAFAPPEQASAAGSASGTGQVPVPQGDLHPRAYECGSRLAVQTSCDTWEWKLHPEVVSQIWERFYEAEVDLFASQETAQCPLYFSLTPPAPLGLDAMANMWPRRGLYGDAGLPPDVVETILSARAPSTGRSYAFKWHIFKNWCMAHHVDPVHCQVVQCWSSCKRNCPQAHVLVLWVYVATISACHVLIDGVLWESTL